MYPDQIFVGPENGNVFEQNNSRIFYHFEELDNSIQINSIKSTNSLKLLKNALTHPPFYSVDYLQIDCLADKINIHRELVNMGFVMCSYIPGWYYSEDERFDCIRFAKHQKSESLDDDVESNLFKVKIYLNVA